MFFRLSARAGAVVVNWVRYMVVRWLRYTLSETFLRNSSFLKPCVLTFHFEGIFPVLVLQFGSGAACRLKPP